jgi:flap endonuclease GEN
MGIKHLNQFLTEKCDNHAIKKMHLSKFSGKRIAVDASIYLYRFMGENRFIEYMYLMISIFKEYEIDPIFIFDGASPPEKKELLDERRKNKKFAEEKYNKIKGEIESADNEDKCEMLNEMEKLKKQFIYIKESDYKAVKQLLDNSGIHWIDAPGEADELCAHFMHTGQVYACLSEDMDMFAYGCCRVMRHFSLLKHNVLFYDLEQILCQLQMNMQEFRQVVVLSGTDYNKEETTNLYDSIQWFFAYKRSTIMCEDEPPTFYEWLSNNTNYIRNMDTLLGTYKMFKHKNIRVDCPGNQKKENKEQLIELLGHDGFVFIRPS